LGCGQPQQIETVDDVRVNLDSLFTIGDSLMREFSTSRTQQQSCRDSLIGEVSNYQTALNQKQVREERDRIVYRDTVIVRKKVMTVTDTIHTTIHLTDTIRDTVIVVTQRKKKTKKSPSQKAKSAQSKGKKADVQLTEN
jgi:hypothetical protein